jgi:hypothetical protein
MYDAFCAGWSVMAIELSAVKEKKELVDRVANSPTFQRSPRLREFLLYVADCTIGERLEGVREQQIAANVFNRKADYNPGQDNIVRVEARSLRKRLETYFATEGKDEPIVISMPKGSYSICFEIRPQDYQSAQPIEISYPSDDNIGVLRPAFIRNGLYLTILPCCQVYLSMYGTHGIKKRLRNRISQRESFRSRHLLTIRKILT